MTNNEYILVTNKTALRGMLFLGGELLAGEEGGILKEDRKQIMFLLQKALDNVFHRMDGKIREEEPIEDNSPLFRVTPNNEIVFRENNGIHYRQDCQFYKDIFPNVAFKVESFTDGRFVLIGSKCGKKGDYGNGKIYPHSISPELRAVLDEIKDK